MKQIFINLPVKDPAASLDFYLNIGFIPNPLFSFEEQKCLVWGEQVYLMLQSHEFFKSGNSKILPDTRQYAITTFSLPVESLNQVNEITEKALQAGGKEISPMVDEGFMQIRNIEDPDGHHWAVLYLDIEKFKQVTGK